MEKYSSKNNDPKEERMLLQPLLTFDRNGDAIPKYISKLFYCFNYWLNVPKEKIIKLSNILEMYYRCLVMIDDFSDNSVLHRGVPVIHSILGVPCTINAINYGLHIVLQKILDLNNPKLVDLYIEESMEVQKGVGMEIYWRDNFICPTENEYLEVAVLKTTAALRFGIRMLQLFSENTINLTRLFRILGQYFQISNDYVNLQSDKYTAIKGYCEDISEGKFSFPIIHAIQSRPNENKILNILKQRTHDYNLKQHCVTLLEEYGSFEYTRKKLKTLENEVYAEILTLNGNPYVKHMMDSVLHINDTEGL